jgi:hypothetical protein
MTKEGLDPAVLAFLLERIESVEQLEILLLLATDSGRCWSADTIARELRSSPRSADKWLDTLAKQGLLKLCNATPPEYAYSPESEDLRQRVAGVAAAYLIRRVTVIEAIFNKPVAKMNSFANAFRLRDKDK